MSFVEIWSRKNMKENVSEARSVLRTMKSFEEGF
jgi:hypothetical protein